MDNRPPPRAKLSQIVDKLDKTGGAVPSNFTINGNLIGANFTVAGQSATSSVWEPRVGGGIQSIRGPMYIKHPDSGTFIHMDRQSVNFMGAAMSLRPRVSGQCSVGTPSFRVRNAYGHDVHRTNVYGYSDERHKENIQVITAPIEQLKQVRGYMYDWKDLNRPNRVNNVGFIGQEVQSLPHAVHVDKDGQLNILPTPILAYLWSGYKQYSQRVKDVEARIAALENAPSHRENVSV